MQKKEHSNGNVMNEALNNQYSPGCGHTMRSVSRAFLREPSINLNLKCFIICTLNAARLNDEHCVNVE